jgi:hypothetical protein
VQRRDRRTGGGGASDQPPPRDFALPQLAHTLLLKHKLGVTKPQRPEPRIAAPRAGTAREAHMRRE